jgi:hypothetical protein
MAKQKNNIIMRSTRGMVGGQIVFKRRAGKGYVAAAPEVNENRKPTERQLAVQSRFKRCIQYARAAITGVELKDAYEAAAERGQSAFNVAFKDAFASPEVINILTDGYVGGIGNVIVVHATDDFKVNAVIVSIFDSANALIEEGPATPNTDGLSWSYVTTKVNAQVAGTKIKVTAIDIPENEGTLEVTL